MKQYTWKPRDIKKMEKNINFGNYGIEGKWNSFTGNYGIEERWKNWHGKFRIERKWNGINRGYRIDGERKSKHENCTIEDKGKRVIGNNGIGAKWKNIH